mmetsp:Transcript_19485/g.35941  ORF Transcript_19485/g.35941 Transcript_19485/m.35941 type:complete len:1141 (-) Transcript_19485:270-3692(-)
MWKSGLIGLALPVLIALVAWNKISSLQQRNTDLQQALEAIRHLEVHGHQSSIVETVDPLSYTLPTFYRKLGDLSNASDNVSVDSANNTHHTSGHAVSTGHGDSHSDGHHDGHQHDVLTFLVIALLVGTSITHLATLEAFRSLPYTVVLFVLGLLYSVIYYRCELEGDLGVFGRSHDMWMKIDPHLLLFTMLPALLTGDAMVIDTTVAKRVGAQCIYLAGPGVLINAGLTGLFLHEFIGTWPWLLCFTMGAILAATDPVAVVGLLKELGASPTLTVQIQGESLLNDGTAIVLFKVTYDLLTGVEYDFRDILILFVYMVICSWFLGMIIGGIFASWISSASNRLEHNSSLIQISLTICCAYSAFIFAEGIIGISGVLSTVAASLMLADNIWPTIVSQEAMHEVWHVFEYMGNTIIFFLAGALTGSVATKIEPMDYVRLLILYVVIMAIRGLVVFVSRPILWRLSPDRTAVSLEDAMVMTWGGLRGAVGLALAIQVRFDRAGETIEQNEADRIMFFTGGIAALTLILNATTCPKLMAILGLTATTSSKKRMMLNIHSRLEEAARHHSPTVKSILDKMLADVRHHIEHECHVQEEADGTGSNDIHNHNNFHGVVDLLKDNQCQCGGKLFSTTDTLLQRYYAAKNDFSFVSDHCKHLLGWTNKQPLLALEQEMIDLVRSNEAESSMVRSVTESLLALVCSEYWIQIRKHQFVKGTRSAEILLSSTTAAFQFASKGLLDFLRVKQQLGIMEPSGDEAPIRKSSTFSRVVSPMSSLSSVQAGCLSRIVHSAFFKGLMIFVILANAVVIVLENDSIGFVIIDGTFLLIYTIEFLMKLVVLRWKYFSDGWNALDFMCVVLGIFGISMKIAVEVGTLEEDAVSSEMQLMRLNRIFKIMRIMRVVVIMKFARQMHARFKGKTISKELATQLETISTLKAFVEAHIAGQNKLLKFLGNSETGRARFDECEEARCILESWTQVYHAVALGAAEIEKIEADAPWITGGMAVMRESTCIMEGFTEFVVSAARAGILKEREAECIIHPIQDQMKKAGIIFADCHSGIHRNCLKRAYDMSCQNSALPNSDAMCGASAGCDSSSTAILEIHEVSQDTPSVDGTWEDSAESLAIPVSSDAVSLDVFTDTNIPRETSIDI